MLDPALNQEVHQIQIDHKHAIIQRRDYEFKMGEREDFNSFQDAFLSWHSITLYIN